MRRATVRAAALVGPGQTCKSGARDIVATADDSRSDAELLALWCDGDKAAGNALTRRHYHALFMMVRRKLGDAELAADIVNDAFRLVVQQRAQIREGTRFRGYLYCIAHRQLCDRLRQHYRGGLVFDPEVISAAEATGSLAGAVDRRVDIKLLYRALRELPLEQQFTLELYVWEEMTAVQIAEVMGVSLAQVRHRIRQGKERLEQLIVRYRGDPSLGAGDTAELIAWFGHLRDRARSFGDAVE